MAADNRCKAELDSAFDGPAVVLADFLQRCVFPICVCVTEGNYLSKAVQISKGDVLILKSCDSEQVTLSFQDETTRSWNEVNVSIDWPQKFCVLPPKEHETNERALSMVMYPSIGDLLLDCPTYFEATSSYEDLAAFSIQPGDRFRFVRLIKDPKGDLDTLEVMDELENILVLPPDCRGNFCPVPDEREYTIRQLVDLAHVQRRLKLVPENVPTGTSASEATESKIEYTHMQKAKTQYKKSELSCSSFVELDTSRSGVLPQSYTSIVHLMKPESMVAVSPYNDTSTTWTIPASANLKVRAFSQNDYETPAPKRSLIPASVPLPLTLDHQVPRFQAPTVPSIPQNLVPININNFVDIYCTTFPVRAQLLDTAQADPFLQKLLKNVEDLQVYRLEEARRLFVQDVKRGDVYSLSHDLGLSFIEYPEKFQAVSELLHLPIGAEVTVLEDIAQDFPKPFSLRFGDVIRLTSNVPYFKKYKHSSCDCEVIKCEKIDPEGGDPETLKLPIDLDVSMVMTADRSSRRMISMKDILTGSVAIPSNNVASVPHDSSNEVLKSLPVDLHILKSMKETCLVIAPSNLTKSPRTPSLASNKCEIEAASTCCSDQIPLTNIGLPLHSGIVMAFRDHINLSDTTASEADYIRIPMEKMTLAQFEERGRWKKLNEDYEDIDYGSSSAIEECGVGADIYRTNSTGQIERKHPSTKMGKVKRLSKALNPKHWRHSKAEPEPLPPPSATSLMALASGRSHEPAANEYQQQRMVSTSRSSSLQSGSLKGGSTTSELSSDEGEDSNIYEDVEIGPIKAATFAATQERQTGAFSGPTHKSLPLPRITRNSTLFSRTTNGKHKRKPDDQTTVEIEEEVVSANNVSSGQVGDSRVYDVPKHLMKAKNWASNIGNNITHKFHSMKPKYEVPKKNQLKDDFTTPHNKLQTDLFPTEASSKPDVWRDDSRPKDDSPSARASPRPNLSKSFGSKDNVIVLETSSRTHRTYQENEVPLVSNVASRADSLDIHKYDRNPAVAGPPVYAIVKKIARDAENDKKKNVVLVPAVKQVSKVATDDKELDVRPVPPARRKVVLVSSEQTTDALNEAAPTSISQSHGSLSPSNGNAEIPKPKPRGTKKLTSLVQGSPPLVSRQQLATTPAHLDKRVSLDSNKKEHLKELVGSDGSEMTKPKPPPKPRGAIHTTV